MRNRNRLIKDSIFKRRGFYLALYSTIGVIMLGAVGITYSAITSLEKSRNKVAEVDFNKMQNTIKDNTKSYKEKEMENNIEYGKTNGNNLEKKERNQDNTIEKENNIVKNQENSFLDSINKEDSKEEVKKQENNIIKENTVRKQEINKNKELENSKSYTNEKNKTEDVFNSFGEEDEMQWPVEGKILMEYSIDKVIYDSTLDQFRTNDNIKISAKVGEEVKPSADGKIKSITKTREDGNIITIEHGNGWMTTYSQLDDNIKVSEGDKVSKDDILGYVAKPTIYNSAIGSHVCFKVIKEGKTIDPNMVLTE